MTVSLEVKIRAALSHKKMTQTQLAELMGISRVSFSQKLRRETFKEAELEQIAEILGAKYYCYFEFPDGTKI